MSAALPPPLLLLTEEEQLAKLDDLFGHYEHKGQLFAPAVAFYDLLSTNEGLVMAAKQLYRWLGIKPYHLQAVFSDAEQPAVHTLTIPAAYRPFPYQAAAVLALKVLEHILITRKQYTPDLQFLEFASVQCGFGIIMLNGLRPQSGKLQTLHQWLDGDWRVPRGLPSQVLHPHDYADALVHYAHTYQTGLTAYVTYMTPGTQQLLAPELKVATKQIALPKAVVAHRHAHRQWRLSLGLGCLLVVLTTVTVLYVWAQRPYQPSVAVSNQYERVLALQHDYYICANEASKQQNTYDTNDIFIQRQVDATLNRCASLRNQYNYEVNRYNQLVNR